MSVLKFRNPNYVSGSDEPEWLTLPVGGGIKDAPEDGKQYLRKDGGWTEVDIPEDASYPVLVDPDDTSVAEDPVVRNYVEEAPEDGRIYGRKDNGWIETGSVYETVTVSLLSNNSLPEDLNGAVVTFTNVTADKVEQQVWSGEPLVFRTGAGSECTVSFGDVDSYASPSAVSFTSVMNNNRPITATYNTHVLTVNVTGSGAVPAGYTVSVVNSDTEETIGEQTEASKTYKMPYGINYKVTGSYLNDFYPITDQKASSNSLGNTFTVNYIYNPDVEDYDLSVHDIYGNSIGQTTANCYVISKAGSYKFPLVYGNALKDGAVNSVAYTYVYKNYGGRFENHNGVQINTPYIETLGGAATGVQLSVADTDGVFSELSIIDGSPCRYVHFNVLSIPVSGANGIISVLDSSGTIMWSWHIWVWTEDMTPVEITNATGVTYRLLPYSLASKWDDDAKTHIKNWTYQWGRATPYICIPAYNKQGIHENFGVLQPDRDSQAQYYKYGIQNPATFYEYSYEPPSYGMYWCEDACNSNRRFWDAAYEEPGASDNDVVKTVYDPSPVGFKAPNGNAFTGLSFISHTDGVTMLSRYSGDSVGMAFPVLGSSTTYYWTSASFLYYGEEYGATTGIGRYVESNRSLVSYEIYKAEGASFRPVEE